MIRFRDADSNTIEISPVMKHFTARFTSGVNMMAQYMPQNYKQYDIHYNKKAVLTAADLDALFACSDAEKVTLGDAFDVNGDLEYRVAGLRNMTKLKTLSVHIAMPRYPTVQMSPFTVNGFRFVDIVLPSSMTMNQQKLFANAQQVSQKWEMEFNHPVMHFRKSA